MPGEGEFFMEENLMYHQPVRSTAGDYGRGDLFAAHNNNHSFTAIIQVNLH